MGLLEKSLNAIKHVFSRSARDKRERDKLLSEKFRLEEARAENIITEENYAARETVLQRKIIALDLEKSIRERIEKVEKTLLDKDEQKAEEVEEKLMKIKKELRENRQERNKKTGTEKENINKLNEIYSRLTDIELKAKNLGKETEREKRISTIMKETGTLLAENEKNQKPNAEKEKPEKTNAENFEEKHLLMPRREKLDYDITTRKNPKKNYLG